MELMEGGSLYEWLHSDLDIGWDVRLRYDETQSTPHSLVVLSISYTIDKDIVKRKKLEREERGEQERRLTVHRLAQQAAIGLNVLHSSNPSVIHRDLKSLNYMVSMDGNVVKLIDFGLSKINYASWRSVSTAPREGISLFFFLPPTYHSFFF